MKWFRFYHDAIDDPKVQRLEPVLFKFWVNMLCLASRSDERGTVTLDVGEIAFALRMDDSETEQHIADLIDAGLLESGEIGLDIHAWHKRQFKSDDVTARVTGHRAEVKQDESPHETLQATPDETLHETLDSSARDRHRGELETEPEAEENQNTKPRARRRYPPEFEAFWTAYPRGHGVKKLAHAEWLKIRPDPDTVAAIMAGLERWKACDRWKRGYPRDAERFLKYEMWDDDPPAPPPMARASPNGAPGPRGYTPDQLLAKSRGEM